MTTIKLSKIKDQESYTCTNEKGQSIELSGNGTAVGPMESLLMAVAGCSTIDIEMLLAKMRQPLEDIKVEVKGERREEIPRIYTNIHLHYSLTGKLKKEKVEKVIDMSVEKYCSVSKMLESKAKITTSYEIVGS